MVRALMVLGVCGSCLVMAAADQTSVPQQVLRSHPPAVFALTGAKVVASPERTLESATVVIRDGKIEAVGADVDAPPDAKVIDLKGKTIYAGFIDAYSEQTLSTDRLTGSARYWNGQVTPQLAVADQLTQISDANTLRRQGIVAQVVVPADGIVRGLGSVVALVDGDANATLISRDVAQVVQLTASRRGSGYPGSPMGAVALARQAFYDAQWFRDATAAIATDSSLPAIEANDALAALQPTLSGSMPVIVPCSNEQFALRADRFAVEFGLNVILRGSGSEYRRLSEVAALKRPIILPLAFPRAPNVGTSEAAQDVTFEQLLQWDIAPENPGRVDAAGVRFAFTSDRLQSKGDFLKSLRTAVQRGLNPTSALKALTTTPAALYGIEDQLGTVEAGRRASLVITDGDLFDRKTKVVETWVNGSRYEHSPAPARSAGGYYEVTLPAIAAFPNRLYLEITETDGRLRGRISREPISKSAPRRARRGRDAADENTKSVEPAGEGKPAADAPTGADKPAEDTLKSDPSDKSDKSDSSDETKPVLDLESVRLNDTALTATFKGKDWGFDGVVRLSLTMTETDATVKDRPAAIGSVVWTDGSTAPASATRVDQPGSENEDKAKDDAPNEQSPNGDAPAPGDGNKSESEKTEAPKMASFDVNYPLGAFGRAAIPEPAKLTAFVHATLWTLGAAGTIEDGTLIVGEGKIIAAGKDIVIPEAAEVIDVRGMHITPGIIDCHSHMATDGGVNEGTEAVTCEVRIGDFVDANDITIYRQLAGGVTSANILHGSANPIGGQNQVIKLRWGLSGEQMKFAEAPQGVKFALGENVKQSNRSDAGGGGRYPTSRMGVEQVYRNSFEAARDYARKWDDWSKTRRGLPPRRDLELDALREIVEGSRWIHCHSYRQDEILALIRILDEYGVTIGTFQHILEGYKVADAMAKHGAMASAFSDWWAYKFEVYDAIPHAGALMHQQGVVVSFNSDDGELARHLNQEAAKAIKYGGVARDEALKFVTLNPARQLRVDHLVGTLETGKHADFVVWNGDPLSNFTRCEQTWIDGRRYFSRDDDDVMRKQSEERRNTLIQKVLSSGEEMRPAGDRDVDPASLWTRIDEYCRHLTRRDMEDAAVKELVEGQ